MSVMDKFKGWGASAGDAQTRLAAGASAFDAASTQHDADSSMHAESESPSAFGTYPAPSRAPSGMATAAPVVRPLPLIGSRPVAAQQRILGALLLAGIVGLVVMTALSLLSVGRGAGRLGAAGEAQMQSQRLARSVSQALLGNAQAFAEVRNSAQALGASVRGLKSGEGGIAAAPASVQQLLDPVLPLVERAEKNAATVVDRQPVLTQVGQALKAINRQSAELLETAQAVATLKLQQGAAPAEIAAAGQLVMLTQRIGKSASEFQAVGGAGPEAVFHLGKDLDAFRDLARALLDGNSELRLSEARDTQVRERLAVLLRQFEPLRAQGSVVLSSLQRYTAAVEAQAAIAADSEPLRKGLDAVQQQLLRSTGFDPLSMAVLLLSALALVLGALGLLRLFVNDQAQRAATAEAQRLEAERLEQEAKRVNDANQAAILRLMNELQTVAEGDLTQQATVTEDITGAIADSVNYTVEELRTLVSQVQGTVARVTDTTEQVEATSSELLATASEQLREIRDTGESVLQMAGRINDVSAQAVQTAAVARQSLQAAETGLQAVQDTIGGMHSIRDQIQETSKRIKRLGESSQEIGEITELISDITEQTNVLALNAAIQAASAGEAGRGFSVVAEEVQRLAERSADATRQIAALVRAIQTDTQDAVGAMERSTQGVVEGTRLSDAAGTALAEIDSVSRRLAELITRISAQASSEAQSANVVATNIQHIFAVTEQTGEGTRSTAQMVRELSRTAEELQQSVARFKIA